MAEDPEVTAMQQLTKSLTPLDEAARQRVIDWAIQRFGSGGSTNVKRPALPGNNRQTPAGDAGGSTYADFADLYDAAKPKTDHLKALVGGYWLQVCQSEASFPSASVNDLLKNHGHPVSNITRAFDTLRDSKPAYAAQIEKSGKTKQARKKMKLTTAGIRKVQAMIAGADEE